MTYLSTLAWSTGSTAFSENSCGSSVNTVFSNWCSREVSRLFTASTAVCVSWPKNFSNTSTPLEFSPSRNTSRSYEKMSLRRWIASENVSDRTRSGRVPAMDAGTSAASETSTRFADHGAPPTLRRISMYSIGLATVPLSMFLISHMHSSSRLWVLVVNRRRQSCDINGIVRCHRSTRPRSVGFRGSGAGSVPLIGMNAGNRSR